MSFNEQIPVLILTKIWSKLALSHDQLQFLKHSGTRRWIKTTEVTPCHKRDKTEKFLYVSLQNRKILLLCKSTNVLSLNSPPPHLKCYPIKMLLFVTFKHMHLQKFTHARTSSFFGGQRHEEVSELSAPSIQLGQEVTGQKR